MKKSKESLRDLWTNISIMGIPEGEETESAVVVDWMFVSHPNLHVEVLTSDEMVLGSRTLGWLHHEGDSSLSNGLMNFVHEQLTKKE